MITIQLAANETYPPGISYKIAPVFMNGINTKKCFKVNGTKSEPVTTQSVLPDLTGFMVGVL